MKTLEEIIKACEFYETCTVSCEVCPYADHCKEKEYLFNTVTDAHYYLRMYQSDMQMYAANQKLWEDELKRKIQDFGDAKDRYIAKLKELEIGTLNNPLTFAEIRGKLGCPVWMEYENIKKWVLVNCFDSTIDSTKGIALTDRYGTDFVFSQEAVDKGDVKVYRRERK